MSKVMKWMDTSKLGYVVSLLLASTLFFAVFVPIYVGISPVLNWFEHFYRDTLHIGALVDWFENVWLR